MGQRPAFLFSLKAAASKWLLNHRNNTQNSIILLSYLSDLRLSAAKNPYLCVSASMRLGVKIRPKFRIV
jgi:hypothetical protein